MSKRQWTLEYPGFTGKQIQLFCLLLIGIIEFLLFTVNPLRPQLGQFMVEQFTIVPVLIFLGATLTQKQSRTGTLALLLGGITVAWMVLAQCAQALAWEGPLNLTMWWVPYLVAFPFAAVTQDADRRRGLWILGGTAAACAAAGTLGGILLLLDALPNFLKNTIIFDGDLRLVAFSHPNIGGWMFLIGIDFTVTFGFQVKKKWLRYSLWAAAALELAVMALTNSRTTILMTCAFIAGVVFFCIWKKGWKRFVTGLLAAVVTLVGLYAVTDQLYQMNYAHQRSLLEEKAAVSAEIQEKERSWASEELTLDQVQERNSFWEDVATFNNRTGIWKASFQALKDNPVLLVRGTTHISRAVEAAGNPFGILHTHNAWIEMLMAFGVPGLLMALVFTVLALWCIFRILFRPQRDMVQVCVALLSGCMLVAGILEPFLFTSYIYCHFYPVIFFLCNGYLLLWQKKPETAQ